MTQSPESLPPELQAAIRRNLFDKEMTGTVRSTLNKIEAASSPEEIVFLKESLTEFIAEDFNRLIQTELQLMIDRAFRAIQKPIN